MRNIIFLTRNWLAPILVLLAVTASVGNAYSQHDSLQASHSVANNNSPMKNFLKDIEGKEAVIPDYQAMDSSVIRARSEHELSEQRYFKRQYDEYYTKNLDHRLNTFSWQLLSGKIIFVFVLLVVLCGVVFSGIQFFASFKRLMIQNRLLEKNALTEVGANFSPDKSEVDLTTSGLKANSSVIGIIVLVISLAFLYMYLVYVYPISELKVEAIPSVETTSTVLPSK